MADELVICKIARRDVSFGELPHPVFGRAWWGRSEHAAFLANFFSGWQCKFNGNRHQDFLVCQEYQGSRCVRRSLFLFIDSIDVGKEDIMVIHDEQPLLGQSLQQQHDLEIQQNLRGFIKVGSNRKM